MILKPSYVNWLTLLTVIAFFWFGLSVNKVINVSFYLLIVIAIVTLLFQQNARMRFWRLCQEYWPINLAMFGAVGAIFINQLSTKSMDAYLYDYPSRLALFGLLFWVLLQLPVRQLLWIKWGWIAGVMLCALQVYWMKKGSDGRPELLVWYIELVLLLGVFSLISIGWNDPANKAVFIVQSVVQIFAGACGLYSAYTSETRGLWVAVPFFLLLLFATFVRNCWRRRNIILIISVIALIGVGFSTTDLASKRIRAAQENIQLYTTQQNVDTSLGVRFQLWKGSWLLFKENPVFGVGREHYSEAMQRLVDRKVITPTAATFLHSHNEILFTMMTLGLVGLVGILLIYLVPVAYFMREIRHVDLSIRATAAMGLSLCFGYMIFGLVDVMFKYNAANNFYSIAIAVLFAHIVNRKKELEKPA